MKQEAAKFLLKNGNARATRQVHMGLARHVRVLNFRKVSKMAEMVPAASKLVFRRVLALLTPVNLISKFHKDNKV